jgi:penicillin-binding protein 2
VLPTKEWKAKRFARYKEEFRRWYPADVVSIGIGQGFNAYTPLQMANGMAILANDGVAYKPHLVQEVVDARSGKSRLIAAKPDHVLPFKQENFEYVKAAMQSVLKPGGTAWRLGVGLPYTMAGKTGTAQVVAIKQGAKYNASALAEQYRDHSWFVAFAPVDKPRIAVAIIVENAGFGAAAAAPIARGLFDYYITGKVPGSISGDMKTMPMDTADDAAAASD